MTENTDQIAPHDRAARACYEGRFQGELARVPEWDKLPEYAKDRWRSAVAAVFKVSPASTHGSRLNEAALQTAMEYSTSVMADIDTAEMREAIRIYLDAAATPAPESHLRGYEFDRYVNGRLMAEGVTVEKAKSFEEAMVTAARLASRGPNGEVPVLVLHSPSTQKDNIWHGHHSALKLSGSTQNCGSYTEKVEPAKPSNSSLTPSNALTETGRPTPPTNSSTPKLGSSVTPPPQTNMLAIVGGGPYPEVWFPWSGDAAPPLPPSNRIRTEFANGSCSNEQMASEYSNMPGEFSVVAVGVYISDTFAVKRMEEATGCRVPTPSPQSNLRGDEE